jgi:hypothetical protein
LLINNFDVAQETDELQTRCRFKRKGGIGEEKKREGQEKGKEKCRTGLLATYCRQNRLLLSKGA